MPVTQSSLQLSSARLAVPSIGSIHTCVYGDINTGCCCCCCWHVVTPAGDFSKKSTALYTRRWMKAFGHDFPMSTKFAELVYRCGGFRGLGYVQKT
jgi:hypothetical protein